MLRAQLNRNCDTANTTKIRIKSRVPWMSDSAGRPNPPPPREEAMSGLANTKRKLAEIDKERDKFINSQDKIKDDSFTKMSGNIVNLRKDLSGLRKRVVRKMKELKEIMSSLINSRLIPKRGLTKRKKGKLSGTEHGLSSYKHTSINPSIAIMGQYV
jgi:hypothetical protein